MTRRNINPGPDHGQFDFSKNEPNTEIIPEVVASPLELSPEDRSREVGRVYITEIKKMLEEGIPQDEVLENINSRLKALGLLAVAERVEDKPSAEENTTEISEPEVTPIEEPVVKELTDAEKYDREFDELFSEIYDQIERNYPSGDLARKEAERKARLRLGSRPEEKSIDSKNENNEASIDSKWLGYFKPQPLLNMINAASKLNSASGRVAQGMMHIDNPSLTMKRRGADIYRPIEAEVKYLLSRGILSGNVRDLSIAMFNDFMKDFGGRQYGGAVYHPRNSSHRETMDSLSSRISLLKKHMHNTQNPVEIASYKDLIKDLTSKRKAQLSIIVKGMSDSEKVEHQAYKNRIKLKKILEK